MNTDTTGEIAITLSKGKIVLLMLGAAAFVAAGLWFWSIADTQTRYSPLKMKGLGLACIVFFGLCGVYSCSKLFDRRPGLIIDREGIVDHSSAVSVGRVRWDEIIGMKVLQVRGQRFLSIRVVDPQEYIKRSGFFLRLLNAANAKTFGSPINISANSLKMDFDELVRVLAEAFERHKAGL